MGLEATLTLEAQTNRCSPGQQGRVTRPESRGPAGEGTGTSTRSECVESGLGHTNTKLFPPAGGPASTLPAAAPNPHRHLALHLPGQPFFWVMTVPVTLNGTFVTVTRSFLRLRPF